MKNYKRTKYACYMTNISMSVVSILSPLLFLTFRSLYGISYSMLGALVLINFSTQLLIDLIFSFYSHKFDIKKTVKLTPALTATGLFVYAVFPFLFPDAVFLGLTIGTIIFAASGGLAEVLISPVIAGIPAENPEREMSKLHSIYAWGVVGVVIISTLFLKIFGTENWQWMIFFWMIVPLVSCLLFCKADIPELSTPEKASNVLGLICNKKFLLCFFCIFLGGASECTMSQWSSSYIEQALKLPKVWGDIFGVAMFALMLGLGRTLYSKFGKNVYTVLVAGTAGATVCYITAAISNIALIGLIACVLTGFCTAMLWPGSLIVASDRFSSSGVAVFALMAAGGDLGGSIGPQIVGAITDFTIRNNAAVSVAHRLNLTPDQLGMKIGLISAAAFPLLATVFFAIIFRQHRKHSTP